MTASVTLLINKKINVRIFEQVSGLFLIIAILPRIS